ncbi:nucleotidyltransferase domain-containing protein [Streptomyces sp. H27-H1]|uniref:nucleotidyltransferase domain-containing protein n=1 Tax=Streptomyces sp. H27-H1 TaxID=2996461 RepID=UPI003B6332EB
MLIARARKNHLVFAPDGSATQASPEPGRPYSCPAACFVTGTIRRSAVPYLSAEQRVHFHQGYEPADRDRHDMARLRDRRTLLIRSARRSQPPCPTPRSGALMSPVPGVPSASP